MKLQLTLATIILAMGSSAVQAEQKKPGILASITPEKVQLLKQDEIENTRGMYRICTVGGGSYSCSYSSITHYSNIEGIQDGLSSNQYISIDRTIAGLWFVSR